MKIYNNSLKINPLYISVLLLLLVSCDWFQKQNPDNIVARVNEHLLYEEDLIKALPKDLSYQDSVVFAKSYIDKWAKNKIILDKAKFNLSIEEQKRYNQMVDNYKTELYKKAYMDALLQKKVDSIIDSLSIVEYYKEHKDIFRVNEYLIKLRYLYIKNNLKNFSKIKENFKRFDIEDQDYLLNDQLKFDKVNLNDSVWVKSIDVYRQLDDLSSSQHKNLLGKNRYIEIEDSIGTYLIFVKDVLKPNSRAPISYIKPTIEQILKSKKKLELKSILENQILNDAIKNNDYETFE